jgi:hypothetical protein
MSEATNGRDRVSIRQSLGTLAIMAVLVLRAPGAIADEPRAKPGWTLTFAGLGPVRIGMTVPQASKALHVPLEEDGPEGDCHYASNGDALPDVRFMVARGKIARIDCRDAGFRTSRGAGVGSTEAEIKALHPAVRVENHHYDPAGHYLTLSSQDERHAIRFESDGKKVTDVLVGERDRVTWVEGCL